MSNLYEILEVSQKASKEVIEKAYKVLAKKYHPDLQQGIEKQEAEKKMKEINEAYEILSDEEKRRQYDLELEQEEAKQKQAEIEKQIQHEYQQSIEKEKQQEEIQKSNTEKEENIRNQNREILQNEIQNAYQKAYYRYLRSLRL